VRTNASLYAAPPRLLLLLLQMLLLLLQIYQEGTHLMVPWFERPVIFDVRARPSLIQSQSGSRDLQMVRVFGGERGGEGRQGGGGEGRVVEVGCGPASSNCA
jgi:hypothetical protein